MKILSVVGARPNLPKICPILREFAQYPDIESILVHTGQHYSEELSHIFFQQLKIAEPNFNLEVGSGSHAKQTAEILNRIEPVLLETNPDLVLVVGDVNSTFAGALAATKFGIPVAHVEAGLRSFDRSMPEEINRVLTDTIADYLFVTEQSGVDNLLREGKKPECVFLVGNVMIDSLVLVLPGLPQNHIGTELGLVNGTHWRRYGVLTLHRPANVDAPEKLQSLLDSIDKGAGDLPIIFPVHPRTQSRLDGTAKLKFKNLRLISPVGYLEFLALLRRATVVLTDSGGIQEETTYLGVPCLTLRENTERPATVALGTNVLVGTCPASIAKHLSFALNNPVTAHKIPPFWDGHAARRIVLALRNALGS